MRSSHPYDVDAIPFPLLRPATHAWSSSSWPVRMTHRCRCHVFPRLCHQSGRVPIHRVVNVVFYLKYPPSSNWIDSFRGINLVSCLVFVKCMHLFLHGHFPIDILCHLHVALRLAYLCHFVHVRIMMLYCAFRHQTVEWVRWKPPRFWSRRRKNLTQIRLWIDCKKER